MRQSKLPLKCTSAQTSCPRRAWLGCNLSADRLDPQPGGRPKRRRSPGAHSSRVRGSTPWPVDERRLFGLRQRDLQRWVSKRVGATVTEVASSHVPMLYRPDVVIDVIRTAASGFPIERPLLLSERFWTTSATRAPSANRDS